MLLNSSDDYSCPVCRFGQLTAMSLMDAVACNQCNQIFTPSNHLQQIRLASSFPHLVLQPHLSSRL